MSFERYVKKCCVKCHGSRIFEVLTDVRKGEMFAICLNDTLASLERQGGKKKNKPKPPTESSGGM